MIDDRSAVNDIDQSRWNFQSVGVGDEPDRHNHRLAKTRWKVDSRRNVVFDKVLVEKPLLPT